MAEATMHLPHAAVSACDETSCVIARRRKRGREAYCTIQCARVAQLRYSLHYPVGTKLLIYSHGGMYGKEEIMSRVS
jgi:hypothetical protein